MKTQKIEKLLAENPGRDVEIWYSPTRRHDPMRNDFISTAKATSRSSPSGMSTSGT